MKQPKKKIWGQLIDKKYKSIFLKKTAWNRNAPLKFGKAAFNVLFYSYKINAKKRNLEFSLSKEIFKELTKQNCYYCGCWPNNKIEPKGSNGFYMYNGIDRIDNLAGYIETNCVPCCKTCNFMKSDLEKDVFIEHIKAISIIHCK